MHYLESPAFTNSLSPIIILPLLKANYRKPRFKTRHFAEQGNTKYIEQELLWDENHIQRDYTWFNIFLIRVGSRDNAYI